LTPWFRHEPGLAPDARFFGSNLSNINDESAITRRSADELKLKKGDAVSAVVKATEVMIQKD
jgi:TOBE domain-containing protein